MPEIPELNIMGSKLLKYFKGEAIKSIEILWPKNIKTSEKEFSDAIVGGKLKSIQREGKELHLHLDNEAVLGIHMMLTGRIVLLPSDQNVKSPIFELLFENGTGIVIADGLGQAKPILNPTIPQVPDAASSELTLDYLIKVCEKRKTMKIKELLTNQKIIRGIGNAYVDEILYDCKISPESIAPKIPEKKLKELHKSIEKVLTHGEKELRKINSDELLVEKRDFMKVHNHKRSETPDGEQIIKGKVGSAKTYYTESQVVYK